MPARVFLYGGVVFFNLLAGLCVAGADDLSVALPTGAMAEWDLTKAYHESTPARERICINGLWEWQPAAARSDQVPTNHWGYFKVPACWPGITDYMQKDCQTLYAHPSWEAQDLRTLTAAWHQRQITVPQAWAGRRISMQVECLNSFAAVYLDGQRLGEIRFPGGDLDLTPAVRPGQKQVLSLLVVAMPLKAVALSYTDSAAAREVKGSVARRGLCGDVYLVSTPAGPGITDLRIATSVRKHQLLLDAALHGLNPEASYKFHGRILRQGGLVKEFSSRSFGSSDLSQGHFTVTEEWQPDQLWDIDTPQNTWDLELELVDASGKVLDSSWRTRFGFREFWIDGRDFYLNGSRIFLSAVPLDNAQVSAQAATYQGARESLQRLKSIGINYVYTHNYGCEPGSHLGFEEILRAADDVGMLIGFSQPHFSQYDWQGVDADRTNGYARHAAYYVRLAQNHPSVVMYSMSHNATGYSEDMNPDMVDGVHDPRDSWALKNSKLALRAEAIVKSLDPSRIVYHHASGNLGVMHDSNFYPNFAPVQELSDWFGHWATEGIKPAFTCEYGAPFTWDWTMYRGWYHGQREFGSARVPWELCIAEWNAQFFGDRAYQISEPEKADLRWEAKQLRAGKVWQRWDYPVPVGSPRFTECYPVFAQYIEDNWRAFRTWGVSAISPWEYAHFWTLREGADRRRRELTVDWEQLQRPGLSPDYLDQRYESMDLAFERSDWIPTPASQALLRNNRPLLAYIGGKPERFTSKDHIFLPDQAVEKQVILINNSRHSVTADCQWVWNLPQPVTGTVRAKVPIGGQERLPLRIELPQTLSPGKFDLHLTVRFNTGETQDDSFSFDVLPVPTAPHLNARIAVFDPRGETSALLRQLGVRGTPIQADADLSAFDLLIVGKGVLSLNNPAPDLRSVRNGLKVVLFEQTSKVLEKRLGLRVEEYGLRQVFPRVPNHPILAGLAPDYLRDWRGEATLSAPRLSYEMRPRYGPTVEWCGIPVTRVWRCGNQGNVASVLIQKPERGDFLPILDGGYSLQFSPLLEYHEGKGLVLFCQLDVTGRTETEPSGQLLVRNLLQYVNDWKPRPQRQALYASSSDAGWDFLQSAGLSPSRYTGAALAQDQVLIAGSGAAPLFSAHAAELENWLKSGGHLLALGLSHDDLKPWCPMTVGTTPAEHIATFFEPFSQDSLLRGIGPADVHNRDPRELPLIFSGPRIVGDGVLAFEPSASVVFCQIEPWRFEPLTQANLRRTHRRVSFLVSRLLANMGISSSTPLLERFHQPLASPDSEKRYLEGFYLDQPQEWDDPYRFFRW